MVFAFLFLHFAPSIYWGATGSTITAPLIWSMVGAAYSAIVKWRSRETDIMSAFAGGSSGSMIMGAALTGLLFSGTLNLIGYFIGRTVVSSSGAMRVVVSIIVAYLIAGLHHVLCDLRRPLISQPSYVRRGSSSIISMVMGGFMWLPPSIINLRWARGATFSDAVFSWMLFGILTCALLFI